MIKARTKSGLIILGLESENIRLLIDHHPMLVNLSEVGGTDRVLIMYGETKDDIVQEIMEASNGEDK